MKMIIIVPLLSIFLLGCQPAKTHSKTSHAFVGCWQSEDGLSQEVWTQDPSGWLFGYAANRDEAGKVTFFEQMRIEPRDETSVLIVVGQTGDTVEFERVDTGAANQYQFTNEAHDYPQLIHYAPGHDRLDAYISLANGAERLEFPKRACDNTGRH